MVTEADGSAAGSDGYGITIYKKDSDGNWTDSHNISLDWEGTYECYLPAGEYYVSYWMATDDAMGRIPYEHGTLTVGTEDITYNIHKKAPAQLKHTVSGTLSGAAGTPWAGVDITFDGNNTVTTNEKGEETEQVVASCTTKEDGSYTFIVFCDNQYKITNNSGVQLGEVIHAEKADIDNHDLSLPEK